jgi:ATP-dependent DNA helicase PIF1
MEELSPEQINALDLARSGASFFLTGEAGSGKSYLLEFIISNLVDAGRIVAVTSSSGISAENIGGITVHSFAGIGRGEEDVDTLIQKVRSKKDKVQAWRKTDVLVIDEISMISGVLFTKLDEIAREIRGKPDEPFGGIQLICVGDFYQLPPVDVPIYAFDSESWEDIYGNKAVILTQVFRQRDEAFLRGLNAMRKGVLDPAFDKLLKERCNVEVGSKRQRQDIRPTRLFSRNKEVDALNLKELNALPGDPVVIKARDLILDKTLLDLRFPVGPEVSLKKGAQLIFLKNTPAYRNGTRGVLVDFGYRVGNRVTEVNEEGNHGDEPPAVLYVQLVDGRILSVPPLVFEIHRNKKIVATRTAFPVKLAFSLSVHKAQGMTIDSLEVDLTSVFTSAQAYVAISRASSLDGLIVTGLTKEVVYADPKVKEFYAELVPYAITEGDVSPTQQ